MSLQCRRVVDAPEPNDDDMQQLRDAVMVATCWRA